MADLMKLHTYYPYQGDGRDVTDYWERMTAVRLQYLANPGPAATALRVSGMHPGGPLIGVDGIGHAPGARTRIMPAHAWDWSMPTPFSQGWLVGDKVYVGGQISADRQGKAVSPGELQPQVRNTLEYIRHVLQDAGASFADVASIKVAYKCSGRNAQSAGVLAGILAEMEQAFPGAKPALVPFGVDLLYEGLLLEIDATAVKGGTSTVLQLEQGHWAGKQQGYAPAVRAGNDIFLGGQCAPQGGLVEQLDASLAQAGRLLQAAGGTAADLVKLNVYCDAAAVNGAAHWHSVEQALQRFLQPGRTVLSMVAVPGLMEEGALVQVDGQAILGQDRQA